METETMGYEVVPNAAVDAPSGAGIQAAQLVASLGVRAVLTGNIGPNAFSALAASGVRVLTVGADTVRETVERFKRGELDAVGGPTVGGHFGLGRGGGRGRGRGGRRRGEAPLCSSRDHMRG